MKKTHTNRNNKHLTTSVQKTLLHNLYFLAKKHHFFFFQDSSESF